MEVPLLSLLNVTVPGPETMVHLPEPTEGVLPPSDPLTFTPQQFRVLAETEAWVGWASSPIVCPFK
ncbi:hypothetical protein CYCD_11340 [Tenuifilaceae bacterium CYCD]|nr:hypothetical protein CYCD_11340 [Tenuifilaceae bacterium CYCD]